MIFDGQVTGRTATADELNRNRLSGLYLGFQAERSTSPARIEQDCDPPSQVVLMVESWVLQERCVGCQPIGSTRERGYIQKHDPKILS